MSKRKQKRLPSTEELYREMKKINVSSNKQTNFLCVLKIRAKRVQMYSPRSS